MSTTTRTSNSSVRVLVSSSGTSNSRDADQCLSAMISDHSAISPEAITNDQSIKSMGNVSDNFGLKQGLSGKQHKSRRILHGAYIDSKPRASVKSDQNIELGGLYPHGNTAFHRKRKKTHPKLPLDDTYTRQADTRLSKQSVENIRTKRSNTKSDDHVSRSLSQRSSGQRHSARPLKLRCFTDQEGLVDNESPTNPTQLQLSIPSARQKTVAIPTTRQIRRPPMKGSMERRVNRGVPSGSQNGNASMHRASSYNTDSPRGGSLSSSSFMSSSQQQLRYQRNTALPAQHQQSKFPIRPTCWRGLSSPNDNAPSRVRDSVSPTLSVSPAHRGQSVRYYQPTASSYLGTPGSEFISDGRETISPGLTPSSFNFRTSLQNPLLNLRGSYSLDTPSHRSSRFTQSPQSRFNFREAILEEQNKYIRQLRWMVSQHQRAESELRSTLRSMRDRSSYASQNDRLPDSVHRLQSRQVRLHAGQRGLSQQTQRMQNDIASSNSMLRSIQESYQKLEMYIEQTTQLIPTIQQTLEYIERSRSYSRPLLSRSPSSHRTDENEKFIAELLERDRVQRTEMQEALNEIEWLERELGAYSTRTQREQTQYRETSTERPMDPQRARRIQLVMDELQKRLELAERHAKREGMRANEYKESLSNMLSELGCHQHNSRCPSQDTNDGLNGKEIITPPIEATESQPLLNEAFRNNSFTRGDYIKEQDQPHVTHRSFRSESYEAQNRRPHWTFPLEEYYESSERSQFTNSLSQEQSEVHARNAKSFQFSSDETKSFDTEYSDAS